MPAETSPIEPLGRRLLDDYLGVKLLNTLNKAIGRIRRAGPIQSPLLTWCITSAARWRTSADYSKLRHRNDKFPATPEEFIFSTYKFRQEMPSQNEIVVRPLGA